MVWHTTMKVEEDLVASVAMKVAGVMVGGNQATSTPVILGRKPSMASPGPWVATRRLVDSTTLWGSFLRPPRWRSSKHSLGGLLPQQVSGVPLAQAQGGGYQQPATTHALVTNQQGGSIVGQSAPSAAHPLPSQLEAGGGQGEPLLQQVNPTPPWWWTQHTGRLQ
jgi:hypothetical protein